MLLDKVISSGLNFEVVEYDSNKRVIQLEALLQKKLNPRGGKEYLVDKMADATMEFAACV